MARPVSQEPATNATPAAAAAEAQPRAKGFRARFGGFSALSLRPYQFYTLSAMLQGMAESMQMLANGWYAYHLTGSTTILGLTMLAQAIPQTLFSFGGASWPTASRGGPSGWSASSSPRPCRSGWACRW